MADKKISALTAVGSINKATDEFAVVQSPGVETRKASLEQMAAGIVQRERFNATLNQQIFGFSFSYVIGSNRLMVYKNGNLQEVSEDYTEMSTTQIQFTSPLSPPDKVTVMYI